MLSCIFKGMRVEVGEDTKICVGVRLGSIAVGVRVTDGIGVFVGTRVEVAFPGKFLIAVASVGFGMGDWIGARHASKIRMIGSKARGRSINFIKPNKYGRSWFVSFPIFYLYFTQPE
jgi:hypothetical protein